MECCCGITSVLPSLPEQVSVTPVVKFVTPGYLLRAHSGAPAEVEEIPLEERNFILREVIPRLYAQLVACAALLNAAGNLTLTVLFFVSYSFHIVTFSDSDSCQKAFDRVKNSLAESGANAALFGSGLVFGLYDPNEVLSVAFYEDESPSASDDSASSASSPEEAAREEPTLGYDGQAQNSVPVPADIVASAPGGSAIEEVIVEEEEDRVAVFHDDPEEEVTFHDMHLYEQAALELNVVIDETPPAALPTAEKQVAPIPASPAPQEEKKEEVKVSIAPAAPKAAVQVDPFTTLTATAAQREATKQLITRLGTVNALLLAKSSYQKTLEGFGAVSAQMHTLKFLEIILVDATLKKHMTEMAIRLFGQVWKGFLYGKDKKPEEGDGMNGALNGFAKKDELNKYLPGFYKAVNIDPKVAQPFVEKRDWKGWLELLLGKK